MIQKLFVLSLFNLLCLLFAHPAQAQNETQLGHEMQKTFQNIVDFYALLDGASYLNDQEVLQLINYSLRPKATTIEQGFNRIRRLSRGLSYQCTDDSFEALFLEALISYSREGRRNFNHWSNSLTELIRAYNYNDARALNQVLYQELPACANDTEYVITGIEELMDLLDDDVYENHSNYAYEDYNVENVLLNQQRLSQQQENVMLQMMIERKRHQSSMMIINAIGGHTTEWHWTDQWGNKIW